MLSQLVYVSKRDRKCDQKEIENILASCEQNNPSLGITGVLLYNNEKFVQLVEGDAKVILGLYDKIKHDDRHHEQMLISYGPIKEKSFPNWHMGTRKVGTAAFDYVSDIKANDKQVFDNLLHGKSENHKQVLELIKKLV